MNLQKDFAYDSSLKFAQNENDALIDTGIESWWSWSLWATLNLKENPVHREKILL